MSISQQDYLKIKSGHANKYKRQATQEGIH